MADAKKPAAAIEPWQVLDSKYSYRDRWLAVRSDTVRVPNGTILSPYHTIEFPEWVCAIALTPARDSPPPGFWRKLDTNRPARRRPDGWVTSCLFRSARIRA